MYVNSYAPNIRTKQPYSQTIPICHQLMMANRDSLIVPIRHQKFRWWLEMRRIDDEKRDKRGTRDADEMICAVCIIKRQVQGTSCHKSPTATHSCATWLIHVRHDSLMCDMTHSCATWLIYMRPYSFMYDMSQFICDMTHSPAPATSEFFLPLKRYSFWVVRSLELGRRDSNDTNDTPGTRF